MYKPLKLDLLTSLHNELARMHEQALASAAEAQDEANYHVGAMESRYDTFKEEAQYLTEAQKLRLLHLKGQMQACKQLQQRLQHEDVRFSRVQIGALVKLLSPKEEDVWVFIAPAGLNLYRCDPQLGMVTCVTEEAPLVSHAIGLEVGEEYEVFNQGAAPLWYEIVQIG
ncbi:hypothetical protein [Edwardsiella tarda]|uniref:hypothetical protein n=1 Tax=Edwardsiella tarda TaxID=636 RepID=UPI00351C1D69